MYAALGPLGARELAVVIDTTAADAGFTKEEVETLSRPQSEP